MMTSFNTLFSLEVEHDYYGGACPDVGLVVPGDVAQLMRGAGLLARSVEGALHFFWRDTAAGASIRPAAGKTVRIGLMVQNPSFANITEGFDPGAGALLYRNRAAASGLDDRPVKVSLCGSILSWPLARVARPVTVTLKDAAARILRTVTVTAQDDRPVVSLDLTGFAPGLLTLEEAYAGRVTRSTHYLETELWPKGVFGVVEIAISGSFYRTPPRFAVTFQARLETLRYYVVARGFSNGDVDQLSVQDQGFGDPERPDEVKFEKVLPAQLTPDEQARTELLGSDGARVLLFRSLSAVARRQSGRKRIQLMRNSEALIENLPQPGRERGTADLIVQLSKSNA